MAGFEPARVTTSDFESNPLTTRAHCQQRQFCLSSDLNAESPTPAKTLPTGLSTRQKKFNDSNYSKSNL